MKTLNPNFPVPDEIVTELDSIFSERAKYTVLICWENMDKDCYRIVLVNHWDDDRINSCPN